MSGEQLGLRAPDDPAGALLALLAAAIALGVVAALWAVLGDLRGSLDVPPEIDTRTLTAQIYDLPLREAVPFGPGLIASALAGCVLPVVAGEILLRGFAFPALCGWKGPIPAALIVSVLFGGLTTLAGRPGLAVLSMLLGLVLCALYVATGSLLPGIALASAGSAVALGFACALAPARDRRPGARLRARLGGARRHPGPPGPGRRAAAAAARQRGVRRLVAALAVLGLAGCGSGGGPLELVSAEPPAGAQDAGKRAERQGGNDPDAGERIYRLRPPGGLRPELHRHRAQPDR